MAEQNEGAEKSALITPELEEQLKGVLARLQKPVTVVSVCDDGEKSREMAVFLKHLTGLSSQLTLELLAPGTDPREKELDGSLLPATGCWNDAGFCRGVFHGVPGGHELSSFVTCILAAGQGAAPLDKPTLKDIARLTHPVTLQICVSLGCQHCAKLVMSAQRIAAENPNVTAHMVDANLYPQLVAQYKIERVPVVAAGGKVIGVGGMTLPELCTLLRKQR